MTREMKNSGVQWIGEIPEDWGIASIGHLFKIKAGGDAKPDFYVYELDALHPFPVYTNTIDKNQVYAYSSKAFFHGPCITVTGRGAVGHAIYRECSFDAIIRLLVLTPRTEISCRYFTYFIDFVSLFFTNNATIGQLSAEQISPSKVCLPPLSEQKAIADFLDEKCGEIDGLLADLDTEVKTLAEYKKSLIAETVTRGLNPNAPMKQSGIPWADTIPAHWKVIANKYIMRKKKEIVPVYSGQDIISLSMNGVIVRDLDAGGKMPTSFNGYQQIYPGNLLMCLFDIDVTPRCIGLIKNKGLTSPAYSQFEMIGDTYAPYYYYFYLKMDNTKELVHLSKNMRHSLNEEQFGMIKTIQPPMEEQVAIADFLDTKCAAIDQAITDKTTQIETLKAYKASLIYEYVTGKKQVAL